MLFQRIGIIDNLFHRKIKRTNDLLFSDKWGSNRVTLKNGKQCLKQLPIKTADYKDSRVAMVLCLLRTTLLQSSHAYEAKTVQTCS